MNCNVQLGPAMSPRRFNSRLSLLALVLLALVTAALAVVVSPPSIVKSFSAASVPKNQSVTLTFTITNPNGATDLTGVSFNDTFPSGLIIANPDSLTGTCDPGVITPAVTSINLVGGTILAGSSCTFSVDVLAIAGGTQVNTTDPVTSNEGGTGNTATASVDVLLPDMTITKSHIGNFRQGQVGALYTITTTNSGGADTDAAVTVTDTLPAGLTATDISGAGWTCSTPPTLSCQRADGLTAGFSFPDINVTVNVAANAAPTVTNSAAVSGGGEADTSNDTATDVTTVDQVADMTITKTHSGSFQPGQTGNYTLTVKDVGPGPTLGTTTAADSLPSPLTANAMSGTGWSCNLGTVSCTRSDALLPGASYPPITLTVNVPNSAPANVTNTATVSGGGELNTSNDTASDLTHIGAPIQITLTTGNLQVSPGGTTSTTFTVDSTSGLGAITFACSGLPPGANCSFNPASESLLSAQITMTITTTAGSASAIPFGGKGTTPVYAVLLALLGLVGLGLNSGKGKKARLRLALCLGGLVVLFAMAGCGGSGGLRGTPSGSFPLSVTATSATGASASATVTLNVL